MQKFVEIRLRNIPYALKSTLEIEAAAANKTLQDYVRTVLEDYQKQQRAALLKEVQEHNEAIVSAQGLLPDGTAAKLIRDVRDDDDY